MTVFKTFLKVLNKNKIMVIMYTVILIVFAVSNMQTSQSAMGFEASKPDVMVINNDTENAITTNLIKYIENNCNIKKQPTNTAKAVDEVHGTLLLKDAIKEIEKTEEALNDALFYRQVNYIIYIPENYGENFLNGNNPEIQVKSTGDYQASLAEMMLTRYMNVANIYQEKFNQKWSNKEKVKSETGILKNSDVEELIKNINETLEKKTDIQLTTKLDVDNLSRATFYYNFLNYSIIAGLVYVICMILLSFRKENIRKRTIISSMKYSKVNMQLLIANAILAVTLWIIYVILSFIIVGDVMFTAHGIILIVNSLVFSICALCIAFLVANLISSRNAISGIINVIGLGSSFLCGAFVPVEWLPKSILNFSKILPSYWYIQTNELVKNLEVVNLNELKPVFTNMAIVLGFSVVFVILTNIVSKKKRKIG